MTPSEKNTVETKKTSQNNPRRLSRRKFLGRVGTVTAAVASAGALPGSLAEAAGNRFAESTSGFAGSGGGTNPVSGQARASAAFAYRDGAAKTEARVPIPPHPNNGDETLYSTKIGNFSKGLPHDSFGQVNTTDYGLLVTACTTGNP